jgi:hypothetical protein
VNIARQKTPFVWFLDRKDDNTWKYGHAADGMGVFQEPDGSWHANVAIPEYNDITGLGPYSTAHEAMIEAEIWYLRLKVKSA